MRFSIFMISVAFHYFLHHSQAFHYHLDNSTDQEALLSFKSSITSDPYRVFDSWHPNTSFCMWHGVNCNLIKQRVIGLTLANYSLAGTLSSHITNLSFLHILNLGNNSLTGEIPVEIQRLFRLQFFSLYLNNIEGTIPSSLSACSELRVLDLGDNKLQGTIPFELGSLSKLQRLRISENKLSGVIPSSLGNLSSLNDLFLGSNYIKGSIPPEIGRLSNLFRLLLEENNIGGNFPNELLNISSLRVLGLHLNEISGSLPANLFTILPNLSNVYLEANNFQGHIPISLSNASSLEELDLSRNQLYGKVPLLWKLQKIEFVSLEVNQLTSEGEGGLDFITSLTNSTYLQVFSVYHNLLTGQLTSSIGNLSNHLYRMTLAENKLSGSIPEEVGNLNGLIMLSLASNLFSGNIPSSLGKLKNMQVLVLRRNFLSGSIPQTLGNLSQLSTLEFQENNLTGTIPPSLSKCQHLSRFNLAGNELSGSIPKEIFNLPSLGIIFMISSNNLSGSLPLEIQKLKMVQYIDISNNKLSGLIPSTISGCSNLRFLIVSGNYFQGQIPSSLAALKGIEYMDLSSNKLSGKIPPLDSLKFLRYLNLSFNMLQGEVPKYGVFLNTSGIFLSGNTELCGGIDELGLPKCTADNNHSTGRSKMKRLVVGIVVPVSVCIIILACILLIICMKRRKRLGLTAADMILSEGAHGLYSNYELKYATRNFSDENLIGKGSFGSVYKGVMRDGTLAAIKVLNLDQHGANKSFLAECEAFRNIRHRNLVKIISACSNSDFKALVLQFMPNGSLENWIHKKHDEGPKPTLTLKQRIDIAIDVASAIGYLHHECETPFVHCDLKPSNVLLDENMTAHVGDFGLVRMLQVQPNTTNDPEESTIGLKGSIGYIAPEYGFGVQVSTKGDVYSFGILVLEMFTERRPTDEMFNRELNLQRWVTNLLPDILMEMFYEELKEIPNVQVVDHLIALIKIGLECASELPNERPTMKDVIASINKVRSLIFKKLSSVEISHRWPMI